MFVINRKGEKEPVRYDKITDRNEALARMDPALANVDLFALSQSIIQGLKNGMTTVDIDVLAAETAFYMSTYEPEYDALAARIAISNLHKTTKISFVETMLDISRVNNVLAPAFIDFVVRHKDQIDAAIDYSRDFGYNYFGFKTLEKGYLIRSNNQVAERPQHMIMRVACAIHGPCIRTGSDGDIQSALETYDLMSRMVFTHASPTLFNAASPKGNYSSCFLLHMDDSLEHIYYTNMQCAMISKFGGGIGIDISRVRSKGSPIRSTNGRSDGIVPMLKVFNATALYANQCVKPDTRIITQTGVKPISEITRQDCVLTHQGRYQPVIAVIISARDEEVYEIAFEGVDGALTISADHEVMVVTNVLSDETVCRYEYEWILVREIDITRHKGFLNLYPQSNFYYEGARYVCQPLSNNNPILSLFKTIQKVHYTGNLYDLTIDVDSTYHTEFGVIHNSGKRKGSIACYLQPWHPDVTEFIHLRDNTPPEELRARDIFLAMWIPDLFMKRVKNDEIWSYFDPNTVPALCETYGEEFEAVYTQAEADKLYVRQTPARQLWDAILTSQQENGVPYMAFKDHINRKSNQKNIGIIRSSNLCMEIAEATNKDSVAVCNLASIALNKFVTIDASHLRTSYNFEELGRVVKVVTRNLNKIIDLNLYPVKEAETNNLAYRPIGIGVQGLADVFALFKISWTDPLAKLLNRLITEVMYYYALEASAELAAEHGSYVGFEGSPISQSILQYDMWNTQPLTSGAKVEGFDTLQLRVPVLDWEGLKARCAKGVRNSLLLAFMPTASTSQIMGNTEAFEPITSNIYTRSTMAGDFVMVNKYLCAELRGLGLWTKEIVNKIISQEGSVQAIEEIPSHIREVFKTVWEMRQLRICELAADRGAFIDQMQSMNIFMAKPTIAALTSMHMYNWERGQKTSTYYLRTKAARSAVKFSILNTKESKKMVCTDEVCTMCSA